MNPSLAIVISSPSVSVAIISVVLLPNGMVIDAMLSFAFERASSVRIPSGFGPPRVKAYEVRHDQLRYFSCVLILFKIPLERE